MIWYSQFNPRLYATSLIKLATFDRIKFEPEISFFFGKEIMAYYKLGEPGQNQEYELVEDSEFGLLNMAIRIPLALPWQLPFYSMTFIA
jgi:hypothetical protein